MCAAVRRGVLLGRKGSRTLERSRMRPSPAENNQSASRGLLGAFARNSLARHRVEERNHPFERFAGCRVGLGPDALQDRFGYMRHSLRSLRLDRRILGTTWEALPDVPSRRFPGIRQSSPSRP